MDARDKNIPLLPPQFVFFCVFRYRQGRKEAFRAVRKRQIFPDLVVNANHPAASSFSPSPIAIRLPSLDNGGKNQEGGEKKRKIWPSSVGFGFVVVGGGGDLHTIFEYSAGPSPLPLWPPHGPRLKLAAATPIGSEGKTKTSEG